VKFAFIARVRGGEYPVRLMCELLGVSPSGFYASVSRPPSKRERSNQQLRLEIRATHSVTDRRYGAMKIWKHLNGQGKRCGHNRVGRLMREDGLRSKRPRRFRVTTQSGHQKSVSENHLSRRFAVAEQQGISRFWVADITYILTREGWLYLAVLLDLASRRVVGWCADRSLDQTLTIRALEMAFATRHPSPGLVHHSDRGLQYACDSYRRLLADHGAISSMSRAGNCWDNAVAESFFATLKTELVSDADWQTRSSAQRALFEYIEVWYNNKRLHASLGYKTPAQYESEMLNRLQAA
jgi:putative transposase